MAHLWLLVPSAGADSGAVEWAAAQLTGAAFSLSAAPALPLRLEASGGASNDWTPVSGVRIVRVDAPEGEAWALLTPPDAQARINGLILHTGLRVLRDRDEIHVPGFGRAFFSTERLARVEPFPGQSGDTYCPRCKQILAPRTLSVMCPSCNVWHHQSSELPCFEYSDTCATGCGQPTALSSSFRWTPEGL